MVLENLSISEVIFKGDIATRKYCQIFLVKVRGIECAMKVFHRIPKSPCQPRYIETDIYLCESRAYERLDEAGLCAKGTVPKYFGKIDDIDPYERPELSAFTWDYINPSAIFMEYIPDMEQLNWFNSNNTRRMRNFIKGIEEMHSVGVLHQDVRPQNMMTVKSQPDRALWIDFDRTQTYDPAMLKETVIRSWFEKEAEQVRELAHGHDIYYHTL
ncbi:Protein kinase-like domain protein [Ascosphaera apis ARSEF 7405]|uniref:Protein kinase-like domain protein n=1 Tax=Ascosphaera apis ARSEF 7405 TaxID=392613 RepID=A0A167V5Z0_9EURO|nr:Protein kinase-like domain protein [Ascosphaera apis ARSEF 7405]